jgi:outer membrane protein insertion porin family
MAAVPVESASRPESAAVPVIAAVSVFVDGGPGGADIESLITVAAGEPYSLKKIDTVIKQVYKTGFFSDVQVLKEEGNDVKLTFLLTRKLLSRNILFVGDKNVSARTLKEGLYALRPESEYSDDKLRRAVEELKDVLKKEGYPNGTVQARAERDATQPAVDVVFEIAAGPRFVLKSIDFVGDTVVSSSDVKNKIESREGRPFVPSILDADIGRLKEFYFAQGFPRSEIAVEKQSFNEQDGTVSLVLKIIPHERIRISIQGANIPESLVRPVWEERIFEEWGLAQSEAHILSFLRNKGFIFATVKSSIEKGPGEIRIIHEVNSGQNYKIYEIAFEGLNFFSAAEVRRELGIGLTIPLLGGIAGEKIFAMPAEIERLYEAKGFFETRVDLNFRMVGNDMRAIFYIEEGAQQKIERIALNGAFLFGADALRAQILSSQGGPFYQPNVQQDIGRLEAYYLNQGVRGTNITASIEKTAENRFSVTFDITEGRRIKVQKIIITGHKVTRRSTIDRELKIKEGDWARADQILETKRGLEKLGIFGEVRVEEIPVSPDTENLVVSLREGERNYVGLGVGLETKNEPQSFEIWDNVIRPRGTAELILGNIFGRASQLSFVTQFSLKEKRGVISWEDRYFFGFPLQTSINAWLEREERLSYGYDQRGISITGIKPVFNDWVLLSTLRWASTTLYFLDVAESEVDRQHYPFSATSVSESLILDRRDDTFNPEKGTFFSVVAEWAYPLFNAESDYLKSYVKYQRFFPFFQSLNLSATARAGLGMGRMPIHERFFGGGSNSFRGEPFDKLGPQDPHSHRPVGGKAMFLFNFELRFPLFTSFPNLAGAVFYDKGNVFANRSDVNFADLRDAVGLGIRYRTPLGPLRIDFSWNLEPPQERRQPLVFITIGNVF